MMFIYYRNFIIYYRYDRLDIVHEEKKRIKHTLKYFFLNSWNTEIVIYRYEKDGRGAYLREKNQRFSFGYVTFKSVICCGDVR